jgi:hypothetical protein
VDSYAAAGGDSASLLVWTLTVSDDLLVEGQTYSFKFRSSNSIGFSQFTELLRVSLSDEVSAPQNLKANLALTTANSITLVWDRVADAQIATQGYLLEMLQEDDTWALVFDGSSNPDALSATVFNLAAET